MIEIHPCLLKERFKRKSVFEFTNAEKEKRDFLR